MLALENSEAEQNSVFESIISYTFQEKIKFSFLLALFELSSILDRLRAVEQNR